MKTTALLGLLIALAGCATNSELQSADPVTAAWQAHAGSSQDRVVFPGIQSWKPLEGDDIVVRTRLDEYYLLTLEPACASDLRFASSMAIGIEQASRNVLSRFDTVRAGDLACRIQYIREVDHEAVTTELEERNLSDPFIRR